jgi:hypothetical protein
MPPVPLLRPPQQALSTSLHLHLLLDDYNARKAAFRRGRKISPPAWHEPKFKEHEDDG